MKSFLIGIIFAFVAIAFLLVASPANARLRDNPNYGYCKSGHIVRDMRATAARLSRISLPLIPATLAAWGMTVASPQSSRGQSEET